MLKLRFQSIMLLTGLGVGIGAGGLWGLQVYMPASVAITPVGQGAVEGVVAAAATLLAFAAALSVMQLEQRAETTRMEAEVKHEAEQQEQWLRHTLVRLAAEVRENMGSATCLLGCASKQRFTILPDDAWHVARYKIDGANTSEQMIYALTDFYKTVRVLQMADKERVTHLLRGGDEAAALEVVATHAKRMHKRGLRVLELIEGAVGGNDANSVAASLVTATALELVPLTPPAKADHAPQLNEQAETAQDPA